MLKLIKSNSSVSTTIAELGGVVSLVHLLRNGSPAGQQQAVCSLAEIALVPENRSIVAEAKGTQVLVSLLTSNVVGTAETAAKALGNLGRNATVLDANGNAVVDDASREAGAVRRRMIAECGGLKQLITMLSAVSLSSSMITRKMWEMVSKVIGAAPLPAEKVATEQEKSTAGHEKAPAKKMHAEDEVIGIQEQAASARLLIVH